LSLEGLTAAGAMSDNTPRQQQYYCLEVAGGTPDKFKPDSIP
jgi:hypothetical protein